MLRHLDEMAAADKVQKALETVYAERKTLTRDVGGSAGTRSLPTQCWRRWLLSRWSRSLPRPAAP
jgi:isocitrate/isopropylmalate dehydrogenase